MMYVKVRPPAVELNETCLAHLLWDALRELDPDGRDVASRVRYMGDMRIKSLIGARLVSHGKESVICGPVHPYPSAEAEERITDRVVQVYGS